MNPDEGMPYPFPNQHILDSSKLTEFAEDNFRLDENDESVFKWVEKTVGKVETARYEQFLLFPQCCQKTCTADTDKPGLVWERVKKNYIFGETTKMPESGVSFFPPFHGKKIYPFLTILFLIQNFQRQRPSPMVAETFFKTDFGAMN